MKKKGKSAEETPGFGEIADELRKLGARLKEAFKATLESERAKELQKRAAEAFDCLAEGAG